MKIVETSNFVNGKSVKAGDIVTILGEGEIKQVPDLDSPGKTKAEYQIPVQVNSTLLLTYCPNKTSRNMLCQAWTDDTKAWVGKSFKVIATPTNVMGTMRAVITPEIVKDSTVEEEKVQ